MTTVDDTKKQNILIVHNYQIPGGEAAVVASEKKLFLLTRNRGKQVAE